jgi:hypothetical protein
VIIRLVCDGTGAGKAKITARKNAATIKVRFRMTGPLRNRRANHPARERHERCTACKIVDAFPLLAGRHEKLTQRGQE